MHKVCSRYKSQGSTVLIVTVKVDKMTINMVKCLLSLGVFSLSYQAYPTTDILVEDIFRCNLFTPWYHVLNMLSNFKNGMVKRTPLIVRK